jgi:hypothetical protein
MITGHALFPSTKDVYGQLDRIFSVLGTPSDRIWPGVSQLPNFKSRMLCTIYFFVFTQYHNV